MNSVTPYIETEILLAVLNEDKERANNLIREMSTREKLELHYKLDVTMHLLTRSESNI